MIAYQVDATAANYPTEWYYSFASVYGNSDAFRSTYEQTKKTVAQVNVFYSSMDYTVCQDSPAFTLDSLIANIGGTFFFYLKIKEF